MGNLFRKDHNFGWYPSADPVNAPPGVLLRADNTVLNELGVLSLSGGSQILYGPLEETDVHSLYSAYYNDGVLRRFAAAGVKLYEDGIDKGITAFDGSGDVLFGTDLGKVYAARGSTKYEVDENGFRNWMLAAPTKKATCSAVNAAPKELASFASAESPAFVANIGTIGFTPDFAGTANAAMVVTPAAADGRAVVTKIWTTDQDYGTIAGQSEEPTDLFDLLIAADAPDDLDYIIVQIGLDDSSTDPFKDNRYEFTFDPTQKTGARSKSAVARRISDKIEKMQDRTLTRVTGATRDPDKVLARIRDRTDQSQRSLRRDKAASPAWTHLSVARGDFDRVGNTTGRTWRTVRGFKLTFKQKVGSTGTITYDTASITGGGTRAFTGTYRVRWQVIRDDGTYVKLSPPSPPSDEIVLSQQGLRVTIPSDAVLNLDPQATNIKISLYGGFLNTYYAVATIGTAARSSTASIHEFDDTPDGSITNVDRNRMDNLFGQALPQAASIQDLAVDILTNEVDAVIAEDVLNFGISPIEADVLGITTGAMDFRLYVLADDGYVWPSMRLNPGTFNILHSIRIDGEPRWITRTSGGIYVGTSLDIFRVSGTGDEFQDETVDLRLDRLNIGFPPVDESVALEGNAIIYRAADGWRAFDGMQAIPVPREPVDLLWKGLERSGVKGPNKLTGRFRSALSNTVFSASTPEGDETDRTTILHRYDFGRQKWYRHIYPYNVRDVYRDLDGKLLVGDDEGHVWELDTGIGHNLEPIAVEMWTRVDDDGGPLRRKDPFDILMEIDTGGLTATVGVHLDGSETAAYSFDVVASGKQIHRETIHDIGDFRQAQLRLTGSFLTFRLYQFNLGYRDRPQIRAAVDTGYLSIPSSGDFGWIKEIEVCMNSDVDVFADFTFEDDLHVTKTIPVVGSGFEGKTNVYRVVPGREAKGYKPKVLLRCTAGDVTNTFEVYWIRVWLRRTGNVHQKTPIQISFVAQGQEAAV